jgi:hypothetical protein
MAMNQGTVLEQEAAIRGIIMRVSHEIDARRWAELRRLFADQVTTDYTSLFGGDVQTQSGDELIAGWRGVLTPLKATQHLLGPIDVEVHNEAATAQCHVRGYHHAPGAPGGTEWMVAGHYLFELGLTNGTWHIEKMTLQAAYQTGNTKLLQEAASIAK